MKDKPTVGVRYCGGCNPRYDRVAAVRELERRFSWVRFVPAGAEETRQALVVLCGCTARCAAADPAVPAERLLLCTGPEELPALRERLGRLFPREEREETG